jgi:hypothetical protein
MHPGTDGVWRAQTSQCCVGVGWEAVAVAVSTAKNPKNNGNGAKQTRSNPRRQPGEQDSKAGRTSQKTGEGKKGTCGMNVSCFAFGGEMSEEEVK